MPRFYVTHGAVQLQYKGLLCSASRRRERDAAALNRDRQVAGTCRALAPP